MFSIASHSSYAASTPAYMPSRAKTDTVHHTAEDQTFNNAGLRMTTSHPRITGHYSRSLNDSHLLLQQPRAAAECCGYIGMLRTDRLFSDLNGAKIEKVCLKIFPLEAKRDKAIKHRGKTDS